ncbi:signal peptidase I, partial [Ruminococcus sp.]|uniref:signal peptidase I n=1 Tax=Ruminococcus sp. TaxID=41978 RepID=UPI002E776E83
AHYQSRPKRLRVDPKPESKPKRLRASDEAEIAAESKPRRLRVDSEPSSEPERGKKASLPRLRTEEKNPGVIQLFRHSREKGEKQQISADDLPTTEQLETELKYEKGKKEHSRFIRNTIFALITVAAVTVLISTLFLQVLQIYGSSMTPTLYEGNIVVSVKGSGFERGDIISFYYNNKILVKRAIAFEGDFVDFDKDGNLYVNNKKLDEPYVSDKSLGECDIELPYQVPSGKIFVLGDHRATSVDSRSTVMGCVSEEQIVGKIWLRVWPLDLFGGVG